MLSKPALAASQPLMKELAAVTRNTGSIKFHQRAPGRSIFLRGLPAGTLNRGRCDDGIECRRRYPSLTIRNSDWQSTQRYALTKTNNRSSTWRWLRRTPPPHAGHLKTAVSLSNTLRVGLIG